MIFKLALTSSWCENSHKKSINKPVTPIPKQVNTLAEYGNQNRNKIAKSEKTASGVIGD